MNKNDKYNRIIRYIAGNRPILEEGELLTDRVMERIRQQRTPPSPFQSVHDYAFGWVKNSWFRSAMAAAATLFIAVFVYQQAMINQRIGRLEDQLVKTVRSDDSRQDPVVRHILMFESLINTQNERDSIMVSRADLEKLIKAWMKAEKIDEELIRNPEYRDYVEELIRKRTGGQKRNDEPMKNL